MTTDLQRMLIAQECRDGVIPLKPYEDSVGKWTIGVGRNLSDKGISLEEATMFLNRDIADAIDDVRHSFSCYDQLSRPRQLVLVSMAFNLGRVRLAKFVRFIGAVHRGAWDEAADEMLDSTWAKQVGTRATTMAQMMRQNTSEWV